MKGPSPPPEQGRSPELHVEFRKGREEKVAEVIKERVTKKIQEYFEKQVEQSQVDQAADRLFNSFLQGRSPQEMDAELKRAAKEIMEASTAKQERASY